VKPDFCLVQPFSGSTHLKDVDWLVLEGQAGSAAARVLPVQLCGALQDLQQQHQQQNRHRHQRHCPSNQHIILQLATWSVVLDWIHVTPPGAAAAAAATTAITHSMSSGSSRAAIVTWLEDSGLVQQFLYFILLSPLVPAGSTAEISSSSSGGGGRLIDSVDGSPLSPVSLLELAHAQPLQVTTGSHTNTASTAAITATIVRTIV
jgi:hypothetical protein